MLSMKKACGISEVAPGLRQLQRQAPYPRCIVHSLAATVANSDTRELQKCD